MGGGAGEGGQPGLTLSGGRGRTAASVVLAVLGAVALAAGGACLYVREELLNSNKFAQRTEAALTSAPVKRVVAREIVVQVIDEASPDLLAARPVLDTVTEAVVGTPQFRSLIRTAALNAHRLLFDRGGNVALSVADAGTVVISALRTLAPDVASRIPPDVDATLLDLRRRSFAVRTLRVADKVRTLGIVLPLLALALLAGAVALAPRRRLAVTRCATAIAVAGIAVFADLELLRHATIVNLFGAEELTNADVRAAAGALWNAYLEDLSGWAFGVAVAGAIVAAASAGVLRPYAGAERIARLRARSWRPRTRAGRLAAGAGALLAGAALLGSPTLAVDVLAVAGGALLLYWGAGEVLSAAGAGDEPERFSAARSRVGLALTGTSLGVLIGGVAIALAAGGPSHSRAPGVAGRTTCNGYAPLCGRRVNEVVFAGTHNSMSAADSPGWLIANQAREIAQQLNAGIRAFKISTHYGVGSSPGHIRTDIAAEGDRVNRVSEKLSPEGRAALERLSASAGFGPAKGKRAVWLCHTLCEIGATSMSSFLATVRSFLEKNPGQVLIFFDEDYVSEASLEAEFKRARLFDRLAELTPGQPLPTLGELIASRRNILVFAQEPVRGHYPWDMYAFGPWIQDTPLGAVKPGQFTCKPYRGSPQSPLLMMNDWADVFPPRRSPNLPLIKRDFILGRARRCESERGHLPNLILTDFYDSGDVVGAARELNGLGSEPPAPIVPVARGG